MQDRALKGRNIHPFIAIADFMREIKASFSFMDEGCFP
jgi:hypothetical protein